MREQWYPNGKKIVPTNLILTPVALSIWFCDDGHRSKQSKTIYLCTQSFSETEVDFLCNEINKMGINGIIRGKDQDKKPIIRIGAKGFDDFISLVRPHIKHLKCFEYKHFKTL